MSCRVMSVFLPFLLVSCVVQTSGISGSKNTASELSWPAPPNVTRIKHLYSFSNPKELGLKRSLTGRIRGFLAGAENEDMIRPYAIAVNGNSIAVADPGKGAVFFFNTQRNKYELIKSAGNQTFSSPVGVTLGDSQIFIADSVLNKIFILDYEFRLLDVLSGFQRPTALVYEPEHHRLFVADTYAHQVLIFDAEGKQLGSIGERGKDEGQFNYPSHMVIADNRLYVNDTMNFRIQSFDIDGNYINTIGAHGAGDGYFAQPKGLGVSSDGQVFVAESLANRIQIFNSDGEYLMSFGNKNNADPLFHMPAGIAIFDDKIYVADAKGQKIHVFQYLK